jgi:trigger factor
VEVVEVHRWDRPEITDEWVREHLSVPGGLEEYRKSIVETMERERHDEKRGAALVALYRKLIELNPVDPPKSFIHRRYLALAESEMRRLLYMLNRPAQLSEQHREMIWEIADFDVRRALIAEAVAQKENLEATDADLDAEIARLAEEKGRKPLAVRAELERRKQIDTARDNLKRDKVDNFLLSKNEVKYVEPKEEEK